LFLVSRGDQLFIPEFFPFLSFECTHATPNQLERRPHARASHRFEPPIAHFVVRDKEMLDFIHDSRVEFGK
jgi:hypothetical protein